MFNFVTKNEGQLYADNHKFFLNQLNTKIIYYVPGNHDTDSYREKQYLNYVGYKEKLINFDNLNIAIGLIDSNLKKTLPSENLTTGFRISNNSRTIINDLNENQTNIIVMHNHIYFNHSKFTNNEKNENISLANEIYWNDEIVPKLIQKNVRYVISGDPTCCNKNQADDNLIFLNKNNINYINSAPDWKGSNFQYLMIEIKGGELLIKVKNLVS